MVTIIVDENELHVEQGKTVLQACLENNIYIPNLCYLEGMEHPPASCRLCFVEMEGETRPVPSCTVKVREGMVIKTNTPALRKLQRTALQLLLSVHHVDCGHCPANKHCDLQRMAKFLKVGLKPKRIQQLLKEVEVLTDHPCLDYYPNRCVLCGRCIHVCKQRHGQALMTFARRGIDTVISFFGQGDVTDLPCPSCHACADICPVSALLLKEQWRNEGDRASTAKP
jgi:NADH dehydrogenase/NADH:ubiquinone oxidoreductase subunit G